MQAPHGRHVTRPRRTPALPLVGARASLAPPLNPRPASRPRHLSSQSLRHHSRPRPPCHLPPSHPSLPPTSPPVLACVQVGQDRLNAAFTAMMAEDPKAEELLDQAQDKFEVGRSAAVWGGRWGGVCVRGCGVCERVVCVQGWGVCKSGQNAGHAQGQLEAGCAGGCGVHTSVRVVARAVCCFGCRRGSLPLGPAVSARLEPPLLNTTPRLPGPPPFLPAGPGVLRHVQPGHGAPVPRRGGTVQGGARGHTGRRGGRGGRGAHQGGWPICVCVCMCVCVCGWRPAALASPGSGCSTNRSDAGRPQPLCSSPPQPPPPPAPPLSPLPPKRRRRRSSWRRPPPTSAPSWTATWASRRWRSCAPSWPQTTSSPPSSEPLAASSPLLASSCRRGRALLPRHVHCCCCRRRCLATAALLPSPPSRAARRLRTALTCPHLPPPHLSTPTPHLAQAAGGHCGRQGARRGGGGGQQGEPAGGHGARDAGQRAGGGAAVRGRLRLHPAGGGQHERGGGGQGDQADEAHGGLGVRGGGVVARWLRVCCVPCCTRCTVL